MFLDISLGCKASGVTGWHMCSTCDLMWEAGDGMAEGARREGSSSSWRSQAGSDHIVVTDVTCGRKEAGDGIIILQIPKQFHVMVQCVRGGHIGFVSSQSL